MSLFKLAVYGGIGYLVYQMFFADMPAGGSRSRRGGQADEGAAENQDWRPERGNAITDNSSRGMPVETSDSDGGSVRHKVGRGVVR